MEVVGVDPVVALPKAYTDSVYCKTALIDEVPAAMFGLAGVILGNVGIPFLLTSTEVSRVSPLCFARVYKDQVDEMKQYFPYLENYVDANYTGAVKMLKIAGFSLDQPIKVGSGCYQRFYMETGI